MKPNLYLACCFVLAVGSGCQTSANEPLDTEAVVSLTGSEIWDRTIAYHDPQNKWTEFTGAVRIVTAWADGTTFGLEYIELNNAEGSYRGTLRQGEVVAVKGVQSGECYRAVNGNENPSDDEIERYNLNCDQARSYQQHHAAHVGFPLIAKQAGLKAEGSAQRGALRGKPVLAVPLVGDSTTVRHPYWARRWTLYVDPDTYAMRGYRWETNEEQGQLWIAEGELEVNGIKMPQIKNVYLNEDGRLQFTDLYSHIGEWEQLR